MVRKRCPNGTRKNPKTGNCEPIRKKTMKQGKKKNIVAKDKTQKKKCPPNKPLYNPNTNRCVTDNAANRKKLGKQPKQQVQPVKPVEKKTQKKKCPPNKPLYNPQTNRCVTDNAANRKKLGKINVVKNKEVKQRSQKKCPSNKPLFNPKTNRCVKDTVLNRRKITQIELELDKERSKQLPIATKTTGVVKTVQKSVIKESGPFYNIEKCPSPYYKTIDFNKLKLKESSPGNFTIEYKTKQNRIITLSKVKMLGNGTYGQVFKFSDVSKRYNVAVKTYYKKDDDELKVIKKLEQKNVNCNILASKRFETSLNPIIVCDLYSDSLHNKDLLKKISLHNKVLIVKQLANDLNCLYNKGLPYTDIKLANTLYKCLYKDNFKVTLGDIGSICLKDYEGITTYPPWEYRDRGAYVKCSDKQIVWGLGVLLISLLHNNSDPVPFYWNTLPYVTSDAVKNKIIDYASPLEFQEFKIVKTNGIDVTLSMVIRLMLNLDPTKRISLQKLVKLLSFVK